MWWAIAILVLALYLYKLHIANIYRHWSERGIPYVPAQFPYGNFKRWVHQKSSIAEIYRDICYIFPKRAAIGVFRFTNPELVLYCPRLIKHVLTTNSQNYDVDSLTSDSLSLDPFHYRRDRWSEARDAVLPVFSTKRLKNIFKISKDNGVMFAYQLRFLIDESRPIEFHDLMSELVTIRNPPFHKLVREAFKTGTWKHLKYVLRSAWPSVYKLFNLKTLDWDTEEQLKVALKELIYERSQRCVYKYDFIDIMMKIKREDESGRFDDDFLAAQVFSLFAASYESLRSLLAFALYELAMHPAVQAKVHQEIDRVYRGRLTYESMPKFEYLDMVVQEVQRKYPTVGFLMRKCKNTEVIPPCGPSESPLMIEKGTTVIVPVLALHHNPRHYPDPEKFIPERFNAEAKARRDPMVYLPFGAGPHSCMGTKLGQLQSKLRLLYILRHYKVETCEKTEMKIEFDPTSIVTASKNGIWLNLKKRAIH